MGDIVAFPRRGYRVPEIPGTFGILRRLARARRYAQLAASIEDSKARSVLLDRARQLVDEALTLDRLAKQGRI